MLDLSTNQPKSSALVGGKSSALVGGKSSALVGGKSYIPASQDGDHWGFRYWQLCKTQPRADALDSRALILRDPCLTLYLPLWLRDSGSFRSEEAYGHLVTKYGAIWTPQGQYFDGVDDVLTIPDASSLNQASITIEAVVELKTFGVTQRLIAKHSGALKQGYTLFFLDSNKVYFQAGDGITWPGAVNLSSDAHAVRGFYHVIATSDGSNAAIYVNNVKEASGSSTAISASSVQLTIGDDVPSALPYAGIMSEISIYSRGFDLLDVARHYTTAKRRLPWLC